MTKEPMQNEENEEKYTGQNLFPENMYKRNSRITSKRILITGSEEANKANPTPSQVEGWEERFYKEFNYIQAIKNEQSGNSYKRITDFISSLLQEQGEKKDREWREKIKPIEEIMCSDDCGYREILELLTPPK